MKDSFYHEEIAEKLELLEQVPSWIKDYPEFHTQIKMYRKLLGMTQKQLAKKANTTHETISRIEHGLAKPNLALLENIATALESQPHILLLPKQNLTKLLEQKAQRKAQELVALTHSNSAIEGQSPSNKALSQEIAKTKKNLLENKRHLLWED
jgi:transcriptional regulator with XRE-family HTH domain